MISFLFGTSMLFSSYCISLPNFSNAFVPAGFSLKTIAALNYFPLFELSILFESENLETSANLLSDV